jgi:hypothetical protein
LREKGRELYTKKFPGEIFNVAQRLPEGWPPGMAGYKKLLGAVFNVA